MPKSKLRNSTELLLDTIFDAMHEKKAEHVLLLDLSQIKGANFDYFVITHGNSTTQVNAIAEEVRRKVKTICFQNPAHFEGFANAEWILLDYLGVVVHVFQKEIREHFQLENLWADAIITPIEEEIPVKKETTKKTVKEPAKKAAKSNERKSTSTKSTTKSTTKSKSTKSKAAKK
ncbi:MAG: ribosome silencing factor [Bacteroidales bacterium]|nr:ribosome silencing factor [Bacteroidales bacterium]